MDLVLNNLQKLICLKSNQPTNQPKYCKTFDSLQYCKSLGMFQSDILNMRLSLKKIVIIKRTIFT